MTIDRAPTAVLDRFVQPIESWSPSFAPDDEFAYLDIASVDADSKQIREAKKLRGADAPSRARQLVRAGDVLVSTVRPNLNAVAHVPPELDGATASTGFCVLRTNRRELDDRYLFNWVRSPAFVQSMVQLATGASYPAVSDRIIRGSAIPVPPLSEQKRIAAILDKSDAIRRQRGQAPTLCRDLIVSSFVDRFGDPVKNDHRLPTKPLIELVDPKRPISYGILMPGPNIAGGVPYVRVAEMKNDRLVLDSIRRTTPEMHQQFIRSTLRTGDLLMSIRGHVGRLAIVPPELDGGNITQDTARLAIQGEDLTIFIFWLLDTPPMQQWMAKRTKGVAVRGINLGDVKQIPILMPNPKEISAFAHFARTTFRMQTTQLAAANEADIFFNSLAQRAFRGNL